MANTRTRCPKVGEVKKPAKKSKKKRRKEK